MASLKSGAALSSNSIFIWRLIQFIFWLIGLVIIVCLFFYPSIGILLFWNILIPIAPLLFVVAVGLWRNLCPLATTNLLPRHLGLSKRKKLSPTQTGVFNLIATIALFILVPLRHAIFNNSGLATGILIMSMAAIGISLGFFYEWKSAWCSGLCPVHPVEKLYGGNVFMSMPNANCSQCMNCVIPCPDSIQNVHPSISNKTKYHAIGGLLVIGGLPGFIWGWFQVPDAASINSFNNFIGVYTIPLQGLVVTLIIYLIIQKILAASYQRKLISIFAAAGVSCYYWYRLPALLGLGNFPEDGVLVNLSNSLPIWIIPMMRIISTGFFVYWLLLRKPNHKSWVIRPEFGIK